VHSDCDGFVIRGMGTCFASQKWWILTLLLWLISDIFLSTQKTYRGLRGTISRNYRGRCCCDDLLGQNLLNDLRSWGAGLKPFILSMIMLQCCSGTGGIWCGHYSRVKFVNLSDKIVPEIGFWLVPYYGTNRYQSKFMEDHYLHGKSLSPKTLNSYLN
jgi:hypothetical protein